MNEKYEGATDHYEALGLQKSGFVMFMDEGGQLPIEDCYAVYRSFKDDAFRAFETKCKEDPENINRHKGNLLEVFKELECALSDYIREG